MFDGILGIGVLDALNNPDISYKIIGSFQEPSGILTLTGTETTTDDFFSDRFGYEKEVVVILLSYNKFSPRNFVLRVIFMFSGDVPIIKY